MFWAFGVWAPESWAPDCNVIPAIKAQNLSQNIQPNKVFENVKNKAFTM